LGKTTVFEVQVTFGDCDPSGIVFFRTFPDGWTPHRSTFSNNAVCPGGVNWSAASIRAASSAIRSLKFTLAVSGTGNLWRHLTDLHLGAGMERQGGDPKTCGEARRYAAL
jgi:hypothetical protein